MCAVRKREIVLKTLQPTLMVDLHDEHLSIGRMKAIARQYFWWPGMDSEMEKQARNCLRCQENAPLPSQPPVASWNRPIGPWKRLHINYAGPFVGPMFLAVVDAHSKWLEIFRTNSCATATTVPNLRKLFTVFGIPEHIVSDNGSQFCGAEFSDFLKRTISTSLVLPLAIQHQMV